jgi:hypothetical protein
MPDLEWNPRLKAWVAKGSTGPHRIEDRRHSRKREDEFDAGLLIGFAICGVLSLIVIGLGFLLGQL